MNSSSSSRLIKASFFLPFLSIPLLLLCFVHQGSATQVEKNKVESNPNLLTDLFIVAAKKYLLDNKQFQYKAQSNSFGHLERPWAQNSRAITGSFALSRNRLVLNETLNSSAPSETKTVFSSLTLFRSDGDGRPKKVTDSDHANFLRESCRYTPAMLLNHAVDSFANAGANHVSVSQNNEKLIVATGKHNNEDFHIHFGQDQALSKIVWHRAHEFWGDQKIEFEYSDHKSIGDHTFPANIKQVTFGHTTFRTEILSADADRELADFKVPENHKLQTRVLPTETIEIDKHSKNITFLHLPHCESRTTLVEFRDFLMVIDAPVSSSNGELILRKIKELKLNKPVKYFAFGHHHPHYLGGVRAFVQQGATIITTNKIASYVKQVVDFEHSRLPDELEKNPRPLTLKTFEGQLTVTDGEYAVTFFDIGLKSKHTIDYLLAYFPKEKVVLQGDGIWIRDGDPANRRTQATYTAIKNLNLDVVDCIQGWPTQNYGVPTKLKFSELQEYVEKTVNETSKDKEPDSAKAKFEELKTLVGSWKRSNDSKHERVEYRLISRDSVLVENWIWPDRKSEAMTLYHMDGEKLMATHYCPWANQPRLVYDPTENESKYVFKFDSVTNLPDRGVAHCVEFWLQPNGENSLTRSETYSSKDGLDVSEATYERIENKRNENKRNENKRNENKRNENKRNEKESLESKSR